MNGKESEIINKTIVCDKEAEKYKETSSTYDSKYKEKNLSTSENKEKARGGYIYIYEWGKHLLNLTHERACSAQETNVIKTKDIVKIYNYEIKEIRSTNQDMKDYIDGCHK